MNTRYKVSDLTLWRGEFRATRPPASGERPLAKARNCSVGALFVRMSLGKT
jgi:hypothetical protein